MRKMPSICPRAVLSRRVMRAWSAIMGLRHLNVDDLEALAGAFDGGR